MGEYTINVSSSFSSLDASFALIPVIPANERSVRRTDSAEGLRIVVNTDEVPPTHQGSVQAAMLFFSVFQRAYFA